MLVDVDLDVRPGDFTGVVGPSGSGKTTLLRLAARHACAPAPARVVRRPRPAHRLRAAAGDGELELPGHRRRVRADGPRRGRRLPWPSRPSGPRSPRSSTASASPTWPTGTSASCPAASSSGCSSPGRCSAPPTAAARRAHLRRRRHAPATRCCTCSATSTPTDWRSCSPPTTSTASPPTCRTLVCLNRTVIAAGPPRRRPHARRARAHLRRADGGPGAPRHAGGRRPATAGTRACTHAPRPSARDGRAARAVRVRVLPQRPVVATLAGALCGLIGVYIMLRA